MKRLLPLLLALVLAISAIVPAYATGDGNFDGGGGGMGNGSKTNYWNPGMDGVRVSIVDVGSHSVVRIPIDLTNKVPVANVAHFGKVSKLSYNAGRGLSVSVSGYSYRNPSQSLPKIISTGSSKASIAAIRSYFTDEQVIRSIAGYAGMDFDTLISGDYKLVVEPLAYLCYNGQQFAMTATEAALYDQVVNGDLRKKLGTLTHKNLPLAIFLEEADLGYTAWSGSRTEKASNGDIISSLGIGIVRFNEVTTPPEINDFDYEYRVNTEVITSVEVRGGQSDPDKPVSVRFNIQCSECGSFYRRRIVSGTVKWVCSLHKDDSMACDSNYYSEERIYDGFISMVNKLRFSEDNILGQVISRLEMTLAAMKRNNLAARDLSKSIAELNAKLLMLEQLRSKGYLAPEVYQAQANEISAELAKLKDVRQEKFNSKAAIMLEEIKKLKMLIFELEEPLEAFDEKLFLEIVKSIQINKEDEMSVELLGGLRFRERI